MPKLVFTEELTDPALLAAGKALVVSDTSEATQIIEPNSIPPRYRIEFLESKIAIEQEMQYEVAKIRVRPAALSRERFLSQVKADFTSGEKTNHYFKIPSMVDLAATQTESYSTAKSQASYSFETVFNYISEEYDKLQVGISELNLYAPIDPISRQDFLDMQGRNTSIINLARGNQMQNFVSLAVVQQGTDDSPYYNQLRINQRIGNGVSKFAVKLGIFDELLQDYLSAPKTSTTFNVQQGMEVSEDSIEIYNLQSFLQSDIDLDTDNFFTLSESVRPSGMSLDLRKHLLKGFLKEASSVRTLDQRGTVDKPGFRRYQDIYNNVEAHKEIFCYSAAKHDGAILDSTLIQTLYSPALEDSTSIIDTQVKYGKTYGYKVVGHYMVIGNSYSYNLTKESTDPFDLYVEYEVINKPSIVMIPLDVLTKEVNVVQMPPVYPQVSFKTKNDSSKMISMYLSPTKTEVRAPFTTITKEDGLQLEALYRLPNARDLLGNVRFKTYGDQGLYEVFRLESPPKSYKDFRDAKIGEISMPFLTTDAIFKDVVVPNKTYYYMFRSVNQKGFVSNPTMVYEIMLLVDADDSRIITDTYHFPKPRDKESSLGFRKLLRITPAVEHVLFDDSQPAVFEKNSLVGTLDDLRLGINQKAVWGRKFKIRIKSKTSGKMIDIILNVDLTKNKTEEEF